MPLPFPLVVVVILGLFLLGVPLYLWRKHPETHHADTLSATEPAPSTAEVLTAALASSPPLQTSNRAVSVRISPFRTLRCVKSGSGKTPPERCDRLPLFEDGLAHAIRATADAGPATVTGATVSFVLDVDFRRRRVKVYRGKSSTVPMSRTKQLFRRVREAMPRPAWHDLEHDHLKYVVNVKATYPPKDTF